MESSFTKWEDVIDLQREENLNRNGLYSMWTKNFRCNGFNDNHFRCVHEEQNKTEQIDIRCSPPKNKSIRTTMRLKSTFWKTFWRVGSIYTVFPVISDGPTDGRTHGRTDRPSHRDAWTHLKRYTLIIMNLWLINRRNWIEGFYINWMLKVWKVMMVKTECERPRGCQGIVVVCPRPSFAFVPPPWKEVRFRAPPENPNM